MPRYRFDAKLPIITLYAKLEGKITVKPKLALDTGATYVMIPWEIAEVLGLEPELSGERVDIVTASGVEKVPLVTLKSVTVLGKEAKMVKAAIHDLPPRSYVDGLLGLSFLRNFKVSLDFRQGILEIE
ncbi:MAG: TIGR02281 family clan AA aspartic protease [bacterium]